MTVYLGARYRVGKLALAAAGASLFVALGLFFIAIASHEPGRPLRWDLLTVGIMALVFFGFVLLAVLAKMLDRRQILTIDDDGIRDLRIGPGVIPWPEIHEILEYAANPEASLLAQVYFAIEVDEPQRFAAARFPGAMARANRLFGFPGLHVGAQGLDVSRDQLRAALAAAPAAKGKLQRV